jgi:hypothetical protein
MRETGDHRRHREHARLGENPPSADRIPGRKPARVSSRHVLTLNSLFFQRPRFLQFCEQINFFILVLRKLPPDLDAPARYSRHVSHDNIGRYILWLF